LAGSCGDDIGVEPADLLHPLERWETGISQEGNSLAIDSEGAGEGGVERTLEFPGLGFLIVGGLYSVTALRKTTMGVTVYTKHRLTLQKP